MVIVNAALQVAGWHTGAVARAAAVEDGEPQRLNLLNKNRIDESMKPSKHFTPFAGLPVMALLAGACGILPAHLRAADPNDTPQKPAVTQRQFPSPDEAVKALQTATAAKDTAGLRAIFGCDADQLLTGDEVQDARNAQKFANAVAQGCTPVKDGDDRITLEVGTNNWPMPIPLVKADGQWHFDTEAGKDEIINRHIGRDELHAIGVCRAYVAAQKQYASADAGPDSSYALKFKSTPGKKDGLYWVSAQNEPASPFGSEVAEAQTDGNVYIAGKGPQPFHGYFFRILTRQGSAAPGGKKNYMSNGNLTGGYALVAYPELWDKSGIMTFIINEDGHIFQQNLGDKTSKVGREMKSYNPDNQWTPVADQGVPSAAVTVN
jgi:hypothetical protein